MDNKKLAAAISAVFAYIKTSEEAAACNAGQAIDPLAVQPTGQIESQLHQIMQPNNIWGISGRQSQMQANTMMQMRMF